MALLLIVSDEPIRDKLLDLFSEEHTCRTGGTVEDALSELKTQDFHLVITVISDKVGSEEILGVVRTYRPRTPLIFICRPAERLACERLMKKGAFAYVLRPFHFGELAQKVDRALRYHLRQIDGGQKTSR